jgi:hypothetical protein
MSTYLDALKELHLVLLNNKQLNERNYLLKLRQIEVTNLEAIQELHTNYNQQMIALDAEIKRVQDDIQKLNK